MEQATAASRSTRRFACAESRTHRYAFQRAFYRAVEQPRSAQFCAPGCQLANQGPDHRHHARERVDVKKDGSVVGDIATARITIEDGAQFKGRIEIDPSKSSAAAD